jgi:hypothetical protein
VSAREAHQRAVAEIAHWYADPRPEAQAWYEDAVREAERLAPIAAAEGLEEALGS